MSVLLRATNMNSLNQYSQNLTDFMDHTKDNIFKKAEKRAKNCPCEEIFSQSNTVMCNMLTS
jgi:hypothetical protein